MKTLLLIVGLLISFGVALPAAAQDSACHIDLASTVALLVQAQASAASGDTETALAQIAQAQTKLDAFAERCATNSGDDPDPPTDVALTQTFTLEGFDGDMTFSYPEGWAQTEDSGGVLIGTSADVISRDFGSEPPPFAPGEAAIYLAVDDGSSFEPGGAENPLSLLEAMRSQIPPGFGESTTPVAFTVNDRPAASFTVFGPQSDLLVMAITLGTLDGDLRFAQFIMLTAPGELDAFEPTLQAVARTVSFAR